MEDRIKEILEGYKRQGFGSEVIDIAGKDLEAGMSEEKVSSYMQPVFSMNHIKSLSESYNLGYSLKLGEILSSKTDRQLEVIMPQIKDKIPEVALSEIISTYSSAKALKDAFRQYKTHTQGALKENSKSTYTEGVIVEAPSTDKEDSDTEPDNDKVQIVMEQREADKEDVQTSQTDATLMKVIEFMREINESNQKFFSKIINDSEKRSTYVLKTSEMILELLRRRLENTVKQADAVIEDVKEKKEEKHVDTEDNDTPPYATEVKPEVAPVIREEINNSPSDYIDGYFSFIRLPDGSLHRVYLENNKPPRHRGLLGFTEKFFGKGSAQEKMLTLLLDGKLSKEQLEAIRRAVKSNLREEDIKFIINSRIDSGRMNSIIDILIEQRSKRAEVV